MLKNVSVWLLPFLFVGCSSAAPSPATRVILVHPPLASCTPAFGSLPGGCYVQGLIYNTGPSCAAEIVGTTNGMSWNGPTWLKPNQSAGFAACCQASLPIGETTATIQYVARACPP